MFEIALLLARCYIVANFVFPSKGAFTNCIGDVQLAKNDKKRDYNTAEFYKIRSRSNSERL